MAFIWSTNGVFEPYDSPILPAGSMPPARRPDHHPAQDQFTRVQRAYEHAPERGYRKPAVLVRQIMTSPAVTALPNVPLERGWRLLKEKSIRHLPIVEGGRLVGIVSDRDLLGQALIDPTGILVGDIMSRKVLTVHPDTEIREAARVMVEEHIHALPVIDENRAVVGIVTTSDILRCVVKRAGLDLWV